MKNSSKEAYGKDMRGKMHSIGNVLLTKSEVSTHEAVKGVFSLPMWRSNIDVLYVPTCLKKSRTRILKSPSILEKIHLDDTNVFAPNIIDKYENQQNDLHSFCLADFASSYVREKAVDVLIEPDELKSYSVPGANINDFEPNHDIIK